MVDALFRGRGGVHRTKEEEEKKKKKEGRVWVRSLRPPHRPGTRSHPAQPPPMTLVISRVNDPPHTLSKPSVPAADAETLCFFAHLPDFRSLRA